QLEINFEFENRPYLFVDIETGKEIKMNPYELKERYILSMKNFLDELKFRCAQYHIDMIEADIHEGFNQILLPYLIKRSRLY
ncbi:MAG: Uncharacterized protein XD81_1906, partial [Bacteroidetes bacterium 38_7]